MDGAILFADILLILDAMGRNVRFIEGEGPRVDPAQKASQLASVAIETVLARLSPVAETVERVRAALPDTVTLIGFAGAPWTVAVYAIEGKGGTDKSGSRRFGFERPDELDEMLALLVEATAHYLAAQARAGANALMLFDSWVEGLPEDALQRWVINPTRELVNRVRELGVTTPIIGFPRGAGGMLVEYATRTGISAVGVDTAIPVKWAHQALPKGLPVQGNLDPMRLLAGGSGMDGRVREIVDGFRGRPHIFNLGHGVTPETPIENVERVIAILRGQA